MEREKIIQLIEEMVERQRQKLFSIGQQIVPYLTSEDILQPMDYPEMEHNPHFRYEEGVLDGMQTVEMALLAFFKE